MKIFFTEHIYFLSALIYFILWIILFFADKDSRKQMVLIGIITAILGVFVQAMHLTDWWQPNFVFNSFVKMEDIIFGFSAGGSFLATYNIMRSGLKISSRPQIEYYKKIIIIFSFLFLLFGSFYFFGLHSFTASILATLLLIVIAIVRDIKVLLPLFFTGVFSVIFALAGYLFVTYLDPALVQKTYLLDKLSGILLLGIPIEELFWFFFAGMATGAFKEIFLISGKK